MPATRIVIDVQPHFCAANYPDLVVGVTLELMKAMKEKAHILIVEYTNCGSTHNALLKLLRGYPRYQRIKKSADDGSNQVVEALAKFKYPSKHLRVCGVNTDCCVQATVNGLLAKLPDTKIELVKSACEWSGAGYRRYDWRRHPKHKNLVLA